MRFRGHRQPTQVMMMSLNARIEAAVRVCKCECEWEVKERDLVTSG